MENSTNPSKISCNYCDKDATNSCCGCPANICPQHIKYCTCEREYCKDENGCYTSGYSCFLCEQTLK